MADAESFVNVTEGSGKKLHAWVRTVGANDVLDQFVLPGEYPLASYSVTAEAISIATANDHVLQIMAGSSLKVRLRYLRIRQVANATAASLGRFQLLRLTTAGSGGSAVTVRAFDTSDPSAGATAQTLPSSKGTEGALLMATQVIMRQTIATSGTQPDDTFEWYQKPGQKPIIIAAGTSNGLAVKTTTGVAGATVIVYAEFVETNF